MNPSTTPSAHTLGPWQIETFETPDGRTGYCIIGHSREAPVAKVELLCSESIEAANARLIATSPDLLRLARSAANAFEERLSCLSDERQELVEAGIDDEDLSDIDDQIGHYEALLAGHRKVLDQIDAR